MKNLILKFYLVTICIFSYSSVFAFQSTTALAVRDSIPLAAALKQIAAHYRTNFLYEELNIGKKEVDFNADVLKDKKVEQVLTELP